MGHAGMARDEQRCARAVHRFSNADGVSTGRNNGRLYLSSRDAQKEMGGTWRDSISRWFRELEFYEFIVWPAGKPWRRWQGPRPALAVTELEASGGRNGETWCLPT